MRKSLLIQTAILSLIIIIIFFSYKFFLYEEQNKEEKNLAKINQNITEKKDTNKIEDLNYSSTDENGNISVNAPICLEYKLKSKNGSTIEQTIYATINSLPEEKIKIE